MKKIKKFLGVLALIYLSQTALSQQLISFFDTGKTKNYGFKNAQGKVIIAPKYEFVYEFREGMAAVSIGGKWKYDDYYDEFTYNNGKWGFVNTEGKEIVALNYDEVSDFYEGMAVVVQKNKYGFINKQGLVVIPLKYSFASIFEKGKASVSEGGNYYFIDKVGNRITENSSKKTDKNLTEGIDKIYESINTKNDKKVIAEGTSAERASGNYSYEMSKGLYEYSTGEYTAALNSFKVAAEKGEQEAMVYLGVMYYDGTGTTKDYKKAYEWMLKAKNKGNAKAAFQLGVMYYYGNGVTQSYADAYKWYNVAAAKGIADADYNIGLLFESGKGVDKNLQSASNYYKKAADNGSLPGAYATARCYHYAIGVKKDLSLATKYYEKAEDGYSSDPGFYNDVAYCLFENNNFDGALKLLNQAVTIDPQYANGYDSMGEMYFKKGNKTKAIEYYKKAADMGWEGAKKWLKENTGIVGNTTSANITNNLIPFENKNGFWSYKNEQGEVVIPGKFYTAASDFSEGLAAVVKTAHYDAGSESLYGYIDATGKEVIPFEWKYATPFEEGIALVIKGGAFDDGWAMITDGEAGFIDKKGKLLFPLIPCHRIEGGGKAFKNKGKVKVYTTDDTFFYINENGQIVK